VIYQLTGVIEFVFKDIEEAYEMFGAAAQHKALKMLISM
jgi:hypothetical protein